MVEEEGQMPRGETGSVDQSPLGLGATLSHLSNYSGVGARQLLLRAAVVFMFAH